MLKRTGISTPTYHLTQPHHGYLILAYLNASNFRFLKGRNKLQMFNKILFNFLCCTNIVIYGDKYLSVRGQSKTQNNTTKLPHNMYSSNLTQSQKTHIKIKSQQNLKYIYIQMRKKIPKVLLRTFTSCQLLTCLCLGEIYGLSPAELFYSNAVSQPKDPLASISTLHLHSLAQTTSKYMKRKPLKSLLLRRDFRGKRAHLELHQRKAPTPF